MDDALRSPGGPLDVATRSFFESRFNHDFSQVRVHADTKAAKSAEAVGASAYTVGRHIVFAAGEYAPRVQVGRRLLAHELAHVMQTPEGNSVAVNRVASPTEPAEIEADRAASEVTKDSPADTGSGDRLGFTAYQQPPRLTGRLGLPGVVYRRERPWPFNGYVINNSSEPVTVWSDGRGVYTVDARSTSDRRGEDVDHIRDRRGRWYKIGVNTVTVDAQGELGGYQCETNGFGEDCRTPSCEPRHLGMGAFLGRDCIVRQGVGPKI